MRRPDKNSIVYFQRNIITWGRKHFKEFPWRMTENKWHALVAEIMLQRTRAEQVIETYNRFLKEYSTPKDYIEKGCPQIFTTLGLKWRNTELAKLAKNLAFRDIPTTKRGLTDLPGVGDYIASAFLSLHVGEREYIVDSNVVRIYGRYFGFETGGETRRKKWLIELADELTPKRVFRDYNYGIIDFTKEICKPRAACDICPIRKHCIYYTRKAVKND